MGDAAAPSRPPPSAVARAYQPPGAAMAKPPPAAPAPHAPVAAAAADGAAPPAAETAPAAPPDWLPPISGASARLLAELERGHERPAASTDRATAAGPVSGA
jgi:hypothetical protein